MRIIIGFAKVFTVLTVLVVLFQQAAYAQTARKLTNKPVTVRLCPSTCRAVNGHGMVPGSNVTVHESRSGWARVSTYLDRAALVPSFGKNITQKPALWVPNSSLVTKQAAPKPAAAKPKPAAVKKPRQVTKRVSVIDRIARLRRVPRPVFRPTNSAAQPVQTAVAEPVTTTTEITTTQVAVSEPVAKPVIIDSSPVTSTAKGEGGQKALTWEEVQAKIAAQAAGTTAAPAPRKPSNEQDKAAKAAAAEKAKAEAARVAAANEAKAAKVAADAKAAADAQKKQEMAKAAEAAKQAETVKTAVVLPPKKVEPTVSETAEPTFKSAKADPISLGARPKKLTKKLLDKRLRKLPGRKSKIRKDVVIALRHYALGLLNSGECKGIAKGGASAAPGMLYVTCTDDPTYLRQFPLEEESW